jgi:hypothetical protein
MSRTRANETAAEMIGRGIADFKVRAVQQTGNGKTLFLVTGPLAEAVGSAGHATKFGDKVFYRLLRMSGVEPSISSEDPHLLTIYVDDTAMKDEPPVGFKAQSRGLPLPICIVIQDEILNAGAGQSLREYFRRL